MYKLSCVCEFLFFSFLYDHRTEEDLMGHKSDHSALGDPAAEYGLPIGVARTSSGALKTDTWIGASHSLTRDWLLEFKGHRWPSLERELGRVSELFYGEPPFAAINDKQCEETKKH